MFTICLQHVYRMFTKCLRVDPKCSQTVDHMCTKCLQNVPYCLQHVYEMFTKCLHNVYMIFTTCFQHVPTCLQNVYTLFTKWLQNDPNMFTNCLHNIWGHIGAIRGAYSLILRWERQHKLCCHRGNQHFMVVSSLCAYTHPQSSAWRPTYRIFTRSPDITCLSTASNLSRLWFLSRDCYFDAKHLWKRF